MSSPACSACLLWQQANTRGMLIMPGAWHFQNISSNILSSCPFSAHVTHCALALSGERYAIFNLVEQKVVDSSPSTFFFFFIISWEVMWFLLLCRIKQTAGELCYSLSAAGVRRKNFISQGHPRVQKNLPVSTLLRLTCYFWFRVGYVNHELKLVLSSLRVG